ncbi:MAG: hypothetical protein ICV75_03580 [Nitrospiraceae bacterium]|nr:hypothetical protein [Nitrospiraceae bacterium]
MAKCVGNVVVFAILTAFGIGTVVHAQETAPATPEIAPPPSMTAPGAVESEKKLEGEKERKSKKGKKAGKGKRKGKKHGRSSG